MMKKFVFIFLLVYSAALSAQSYTDVSINLLDLFRSDRTFLELHYEKGISKNLSIIGGVGVLFGDLSYATGEFVNRPNFFGMDSLQVEIRRTSNVAQLSTFIGMRYYFQPERGVDRWFLGLGAHYNTYIYISDSFPEERPKDQVGFRLEGGCKWVIKNKIPIELGVSILGGVVVVDDNYSYQYLDMYPIGKIGYRFGKPRQE